MNILLIAIALGAAQVSPVVEAQGPKVSEAATPDKGVENLSQADVQMPMSYARWDKMNAEQKQNYASVTVDALKWSYQFNDCTPLTAKAMIAGIEAGDRGNPVMLAVALTAYEMCQD